MVFALILVLIFIVFLACFVGFNMGADHLCDFWFFKTFEQVPAAVLVLIAFGAGIIVAILFMLISKLRASAQTDPARSDALKKKREASQAKAESRAKKAAEKKAKNAEKSAVQKKPQEDAFSAQSEASTVGKDSADK